MSDMLVLITIISFLVILILPPIALAKSVDMLNRKKSPLCYVPILNEIRAEYIFTGKFSFCGITWIIFTIFFAGSILTMFNAYGTVVYAIFHYGFFVAMGLWYLARCYLVYHINSYLNLQPKFMIILQSIIYPWGYSMLKTTCKLFRSMHKEG